MTLVPGSGWRPFSQLLVCGCYEGSLSTPKQEMCPERSNWSWGHIPERCLPQCQVQACPCSEDLVNQSLKHSPCLGYPAPHQPQERNWWYLGFTRCLFWGLSRALGEKQCYYYKEVDSQAPNVMWLTQGHWPYQMGSDPAFGSARFNFLIILGKDIGAKDRQQETRVTSSRGLGGSWVI